MKKIAIMSLLLGLTGLCQNSQAALDLELTQGVDTAVPLAITAFGHEPSLGQTALSEVVAKDLSNSGQFRLVNTHEAGQAANKEPLKNIAKWRDMGADHLVLGSVDPIDGKPGEFKVSFQLVNLFDPQAKQNGRTLLKKSYTLSSTNFRPLAHHISDLIYHKLVGKPGVFSSHIAYVLVKQAPKQPPKYQLMVADIDGHNQQALVISDEPIMSPAWSPDGKNIAYVSFEGHKAAVYVQTLMTGQRRKLADFEGINGAPAWAPSGDKMALVLSRTGTPKIYLLDIGTKQITQLTTGWSIDTEPSFSPDGKHLVFTSNRGGGPQIYRIPVAGGRPERMTFDGPYNATASYTKDGNALVLLHREKGEYDIAMQDLTSGRIELLTRKGHDQSPSLAPNDEMVVFATQYGTKQMLGMVSRDAKIRLRLPAQEGDVREPAWSPI